MRSFFSLIGIWCLLLCVGGMAAAGECDAALIKATLVTSSSVHSDWRLATMVTQENYEQLKKDFAASATIYGVPMGANYGEFQQNYQKFVSTHNESLTIDQARNLAWTGLDPSSPGVYEACLQKELLSSDGLHAGVIAATPSDISILLRWFVPTGPKTATVTWNPPSIAGTSLERSFTSGLHTIRVPRPNIQLALSGNFKGFTTSAIILEPLPKAPKPVQLVTMDLKAGTFQPIQSAGKHQVPGCACGNDSVLLVDKNNKNISVINVDAGKPAVFRWDNTWVCQGQGIKDYPANVGDIEWGDKNKTKTTIPDLYGEATVIYPDPGSYDVKVSTHVSCIDISCSNACSKSNNLKINVAAAKSAEAVNLTTESDKPKRHSARKK